MVLSSSLRLLLAFSDFPSYPQSRLSLSGQSLFANVPADESDVLFPRLAVGHRCCGEVCLQLSQRTVSPSPPPASSPLP